MQFYTHYNLQAVWKQTGIWLVVFLMIFLIERVGWHTLVRSSTLAVFQPFEAFGVAASQVVELPLGWVESKQAEAEEVAAFKRAHAKALARLSELEGVQKENETLRSILEKEGSRPEKKLLAAPIVSYALTAVARGSEAGVREGALVYVADTLVGKISRVETTQSMVTLLTDPTSEMLLVRTESGVEGLLVGKGKQLELTQLPIQASVTRGERIVTVGQPGIPPGQFVGVVASVGQTQTAPVQTAVVDQLNSFYSASLVEVR